MKRKLRLHLVRMPLLAVVFAVALGPGSAEGKTRTARLSPAKRAVHRCRDRMVTREQIAATRGSRRPR
jgi:hypothetical protein